MTVSSPHMMMSSRAPSSPAPKFVNLNSHSFDAYEESDLDRAISAQEETYSKDYPLTHVLPDMKFKGSPNTASKKTINYSRKIGKKKKNSIPSRLKLDKKSNNSCDNVTTPTTANNSPIMIQDERTREGEGINGLSENKENNCSKLPIHIDQYLETLSPKCHKMFYSNRSNQSSPGTASACNVVDSHDFFGAINHHSPTAEKCQQLDEKLLEEELNNQDGLDGVQHAIWSEGRTSPKSEQQPIIFTEEDGNAVSYYFPEFDTSIGMGQDQNPESGRFCHEEKGGQSKTRRLLPKIPPIFTSWASHTPPIINDEFGQRDAGFIGDDSTPSCIYSSNVPQPYAGHNLQINKNVLGNFPHPSLHYYPTTLDTFLPYGTNPLLNYYGTTQTNPADGDILSLAHSNFSSLVPYSLHTTSNTTSTTNNLDLFQFLYPMRYNPHYFASSNYNNHINNNLFAYGERIGPHQPFLLNNPKNPFIESNNTFPLWDHISQPKHENDYTEEKTLTKSPCSVLKLEESQTPSYNLHSNYESTTDRGSKTNLVHLTSPDYPQNLARDIPINDAIAITSCNSNTTFKSLDIDDMILNTLKMTLNGGESFKDLNAKFEMFNQIDKSIGTESSSYDTFHEKLFPKYKLKTRDVNGCAEYSDEEKSVDEDIKMLTVSSPQQSFGQCPRKLISKNITTLSSKIGYFENPFTSSKKMSNKIYEDENSDDNELSSIPLLSNGSADKPQIKDDKIYEPLPLSFNLPSKSPNKSSITNSATPPHDVSTLDKNGCCNGNTDAMMNRDTSSSSSQILNDKNIPKVKEVLIEGVLFRASYLGSTHIYLSQWSKKRHSRTLQAKEAVAQVKSLDGDNQPRTDVDLFISTEKIMVLNTNLQEIMMDHPLNSISYIADIGDILVIMVKKSILESSLPSANWYADESSDKNNTETSIDAAEDSQPNLKKELEILKADDKMICHVFESDEAQLIAQSIGQAFQIAYVEFLKTKGILKADGHLSLPENESCSQYLQFSSSHQTLEYQDVLNSQEVFGEELDLFSNREAQKEIVIPKRKNEPLGIVIVESGWGSIIPTVIIANLNPGSPATRGKRLNIGDRVISVNGDSLVGLPLETCQLKIKAAHKESIVRLLVISCSPVVEVRIKRPDSKFQLGFSVQNGTICSLLRGGIAERGGVRVGHRIIEINGESMVAVPHERIVKILSTTIGEIHMKTMPTSIYRLLTGQETPIFL